MKRLLIVTFVIGFLAVIIINSAGQEKQNRKEKNWEQYRKTEEMVEGGDFLFEAQYAFPYYGRNNYLTNSYFIRISEDTAVANLPFFGTTYNAKYGGNGGIKFSGDIENVKYSKIPEKMRIRYSFEVRDYDLYNVMIDINYNGNATVRIISKNRSHMSYQGYLTNYTDS